MPVLSDDAHLSITKALLEGCSIRSTERMTDHHRDTIMRLGVSLGEGCAVLFDKHVQGLTGKHWQMDEAWTFVAVKQARAEAKHGPDAGDQYVFIALDAGSRMIGSYLVGRRDGASTERFVRDFRGRVATSVQVSADGFSPYIRAIEVAFRGEALETGVIREPAMKFGQVVKNYKTGSRRGPDHRYEPPRDPFIPKTIIFGEPEVDKISTSLVEVQNRLLRQCIRRMARLTNAHSKKKRNLDAAVALHVFWYCFGRYHSSIRCTPAMAAGLCGHAWTYEEMIAEALAESAKLAAAKAAEPPAQKLPAQLELPFHLNAGGPKGPQLVLLNV